MSQLRVDLFTTPACPYCPAAKANAREVLADNPAVDYRELNAFEHQELVIKYGFQSVPTFVVNGCVWRTGVVPAPELEKLVAEGYDCHQADHTHLHH